MKLVDVGCVERAEEPWWPVHSFGDLGPGSQSMSVDGDGEQAG